MQKGPGTTPVVRQNLTYFGNDNPKTLGHDLGTAHKQFQFGYDRRHQLVDVQETTSPGYFDAAYQYGEGGRFEAAYESTTGAPGSNVLGRDVTYNYDNADKEQVTSLTDASGTVFTYEYDDAGNQILRCTGALSPVGACLGESLSLLYDGKDQLRRVTKRDATGTATAIEEYWYDAGGKRTIVRKVDPSSGQNLGLIWTIDGTESHFDSAGNVTKAYSHVTLGGTPVARVHRTSGGSHSIEYQFHGLANNTLAAVDKNTGTINASFVYAPFGEIIEATDAGAPTSGIDQHRRRFNDKYVDEISDLAYYGFRYYDKTSMT